MSNKLTPWSWDQGLWVWINFIGRLLLFRNSQFSVSMCMSAHVCENTCVHVCTYACECAYVYVDVHTNTRWWCWCLLCYSLPFILRQAPSLNVEFADLARLTGWPVSPGDLPVSAFQVLDCKHWPQYSAFLYGYWGLNSGSQVCAANTFLTKPSLQSLQS